ncbi:MAG: 3-phosphoshikimate 1-carboxyvinyltransferase [Bacteroidota bacterium]
MSGIQIRMGSTGIKTSVDLPASKSISNRLLLIKALCKESFTIDNLSLSDDTLILQRCIENLTEEEVFDVGDAGTAFRFLTALFAITPGKRTLTGSKRMLKRPVGDLVKALNKLGADISYAAKNNHPPLIINGAILSGSKTTIRAGISSQFISALLLIAPQLPQGLQLKLLGDIASKPYISMTLKMMEHFGVSSLWKWKTIEVAKQAFQPRNFVVEADWSAAAFWYQMVAFSKVAEVELKGLSRNSLQGDAIVADIYDKLGVKTSYLDDSVLLSRKESQSMVITHDFFLTPDLFPPVMATCAGLKIPFRFTGLQNLVIKESDRVSAMISELAKFGYYFNYDKQESSLVYDGNKGSFDDAEVVCDSHNDHRIAMSLAPMAMIHCRVNLNDSECVSKSYPSYFDDLKKAGFRII